MNKLIVPYGAELRATARQVLEELRATSVLYLPRMQQVPADALARAGVISTYAVPRREGTYTLGIFRSSEWTFVLELEVDGYVCAMFTVMIGGHHESWMRCQCPDREQEDGCPHMATLARQIGKGAFGQFRGAMMPGLGTDWHDPNDNGLEPATIAAFTPGMEFETPVDVNGSKRVGLQVRASGAVAKLHPVLLLAVNGDAYAQCELIEDPHSLVSDSLDEQMWIDRLRALALGEFEGEEFSVAADLATVAAFAAAGRLIDARMHRVRTETGFGASLEWETKSDGSQRLGWAPGVRDDIRWFRVDDGVLYQPSHGVIRFVGLSESDLDEITSWPSVKAPDLADVIEALQSNPALRMLPLPRRALQEQERQAHQAG